MIRARSLAYRYARALADLGLAQNRVDQFTHELAAVKELFERVPEAARILMLPIFPRARRELLLAELTSKLDLSDTMAKFLKLLLDEDRFAIFDSILESYTEIVDDIQGRVRARVYSARPLLDEEKHRIAEAIGKRLGARDVVLDCRVDKELIGGIRIEVKSLVMDASLKHQLRRMQAALEGG